MPSEKRSRHRAGRQVRMAELRAAQQRRRKIRRGVVVGVIVAIAVALAVYTGTRNSSKKTTTNKTAATTVPGASATTVPAAPAGAKLTGATPCPKADGSSPRTTSFAQAPPTCIDPAKHYTATFTTSEGTVVVPLDTTKTPQTTNNFVVLALYHYYDNTRIFRTDPSIAIIQGGAPATESASDPGPGYTIKDEGSGYKYAAGDLVMARQSAPNSAGAQFFFCTGPACSQLDSQGTYVTFGHASSGLDVLSKILALNVANNSGLGGAPSRPVTVKTVTISES
ncbi:MAG: peptidylprolyl isomerase [Acidimicrobiales bacterium]